MNNGGVRSTYYNTKKHKRTLKYARKPYRIDILTTLFSANSINFLWAIKTTADEYPARGRLYQRHSIKFVLKRTKPRSSVKIYLSTRKLHTSIYN